jgi:hypothetical protein
MSALYDPARHEERAGSKWSPARARDAIAAICLDAESAFDPGRLWPVHPGDEEPDGPVDGILRGLYAGAAGMLHGLGRLAEAGLHVPALDGSSIVGELHEAGLASPDEDGAGASLLVGSTGSCSSASASPRRPRPWTRWRPRSPRTWGIRRTSCCSARRARCWPPGRSTPVRATNASPSCGARVPGRWSPAGTRTACGRRVSTATGSVRRGGARFRRQRVHALNAAPDWLDDPAAVERRALATARALAIVDGDLASWPALTTGSRTGAAPRVQWCHGAAGIVTALAGLGPGDDAHGALLDAGGELVWRAGPPARNAGLCHGTAGNGFAFLALLARTGDERWLRRARGFAMHAITQVSAWRAAAGRGRYTLFTGDIGAALLAAACLEGDPAFPGIDDL